MSASQIPATVLAAVDDLLLRAAAAFPSSDPQDMHTYATKAPSQPFLKEIMDVTQSISGALVTMTSVTDPKVISVLKEHAVHDQTVFERQDISRQANELLDEHSRYWIEDVPLDIKLRPDFILSRVERWAKDAKMEVYQSFENGQNTLTCAGSAVVLDFVFEKLGVETAAPAIRLVSLKSSYPASSESAPVTQPLTTVEDLLGSDIATYIDEVLSQGADAQRAAQLARRVIGHIRYIMLLDAQAAREAGTGDTGSRWFAEVGVLSPKVIDLACQEAAGICSQLGAARAPLDIFLRRAHAFPLINLNSPSVSFLVGMTPISYLSLLKSSPGYPNDSKLDPQPNIDIPNSLLRRFIAQHPTPPGINTCNLIIAPSNQLNHEALQAIPPRVPYFPLLNVATVPSQSHTFPSPGGDNAWVLDFGPKGLVMRRSAIQALVQALGHAGEVDDMLSGMNLMNLSIGLMGEEHAGWVNMLLEQYPEAPVKQLCTTQTSPSRLHPPIHATLRIPGEAGFILGRVRVRNMAEVWTTLEIIREQCWLNNAITTYTWSSIPPRDTEVSEPQGLADLLSGKFLSIPTQMAVSIDSTLSLQLQFPIPSKGRVPPVVEFIVSYDPTAIRGTRIEFRSLDPKVSATELLGRFHDQVDEVVRRAGPLGAVGWIHAQLRSA